MNFISTALRLCGAVVTAAVFLSGLARAADDLPMVGAIAMPEVHVSVNVDDDVGPPMPPRPRFMYPRGPFAAIPPARVEPMPDGPAFSQLEVARMLRSTGFSLLGQINRRGWVYTVSVINPRGDDGRAIIDARTGAIIRFIPAYAVNARLDDQLTALYGPPGPPVARDQPSRDLPNAALSPKPIPRAAKRDTAPTASAPKLADRMPVNAQPSAPASVISRHEPEKLVTAKPPVPAGTTTGVASASSPSASQPATTPQTPSTHDMKLWPTQAMPDVQSFE